MAAPPGPISFVVLNWGKEAETLRCVQSIESQTYSGPVEIVVVDNGSTPHSRERLGGSSAVRVVPLTSNQGFAGGMNAGVAAAHGPLVALLNNDLVLAPDWLERGLASLGDDPQVAVVGGISYCWDEDNPLFGLTNEAFGVTVVDPATASATLTHLVEVPRVEVASLDGGALLLRAEAWSSVQGFDPDYFAYGEDVDLAARLHAAGFSLVYEPLMSTWHSRGLSSSSVPVRREFWSRRNRLYTVAKHFPESTWRRAVLRTCVDYLWLAVSGKNTGVRGWRRAPWAPRSLRLGAARAAAWGITHQGLLRRKRHEAIAAGQHAENWTSHVASLNRLLPSATQVSG